MSNYENSLKPFGITHFAYNKFISHHKMMALCPHIEWAYNDLGQAAFQEIVDLHTKNTFHPQNYSLWQVIKNNWVIEALKKRNVDHGISIYKYSDTECFEVFHFASTNNNESILNFYINNLQILEELIIHFKNFMHNALYDNSTSSDNYIHLDGTFDIYKDSLLNSVNYINDSSIQDIIPLSSDCVPSVRFTRKQNFCYMLLKKKLSNKEIAKIMGISPRTVEDHVNKILGKLGISSRRNIY